MARLPDLVRRPWFLATALFVLTLALTWRTGEFAFLNFDDGEYVTKNEAVRDGLSLAGFRWAFTTGHAANWHPLTWLAHMLDVELFGLDAGAHHRSSAVLHALNAALLFATLRALTGATMKSALVAAFFAWHPLRAESVAWIAERKDLLAGTFFCACLWAYASWARRGGVARYLLCLALFALGLMAKPMLVTLPGVLLLLDLWPLGRLQQGIPGRLLEKLPFLVLAAASATLTFVVQRAGGAFPATDAIDAPARSANAIQAYATYVQKTLLPTDLCAFYPHPVFLAPGSSPWTGGVLRALLVLSLISLLVWRLRRRAPAACVGWLWFLGMLVPVVGFVQVGLQAWADRYSYLPTIGLWIAIVWSADAVLTPGGLRRALWAAPVALAGYAFTSLRQLDTWRDNRTLFGHALALDERNFVAHVNLGQALEEDGELDAAGEHFARALELHPSLAPVRVNLARVRREQGRPAEARAELERALATDPDLGDAHAELGWLQSEIGQDAEALPHLRRAAELAPDQLALQNNLAWVLATSRTNAAPEEALAIAERLCRATNSTQPGFLETLAAALARLGRFDEAVRWQSQAVAGVPSAHRATLAARLELFRDGQAFLKTP